LRVKTKVGGGGPIVLFSELVVTVVSGFSWVCMVHTHTHTQTRIWKTGLTFLLSCQKQLRSRAELQRNVSDDIAAVTDDTAENETLFNVCDEAEERVRRRVNHSIKSAVTCRRRVLLKPCSDCITCERRTGCDSSQTQKLPLDLALCFPISWFKKKKMSGMTFE